MHKTTETNMIHSRQSAGSKHNEIYSCLCSSRQLRPLSLLLPSSFFVFCFCHLLVSPSTCLSPSVVVSLSCLRLSVTVFPFAFVRPLFSGFFLCSVYSGVPNFSFFWFLFMSFPVLSFVFTDSRTKFN